MVGNFEQITKPHFLVPLWGNIYATIAIIFLTVKSAPILNMHEEALKRIAINKLDKNPALDLSDCGLISLPLELKDCIWLEALDLGNNYQLDNISLLSNLKKLKQLLCWETEISDLSPLAGLTRLEYLDCSMTAVNDLTPLACLTRLESLICLITAVNDLSPLSGLINLKHLNCSSTLINNLYPILPLIRNLIDVDWYYHPGEQYILVEDCPLICPPIEIALDSSEAVRDYFEELGADGHNLNEVKVIFLGEASAGKTSLVKRLMQEQFDSKESQTHGIRIRQLPFTMDDGDLVTAHLWDFGGQEVMHATH